MHERQPPSSPGEQHLSSLQRLFLQGLLDLERLTENLGDPNLRVPRRTVLKWGGGTFAVLAGAGALFKWASEWKTESQILIGPQKEVGSPELGLTVINATKHFQITLFPQRLGRFLQQENVTLPAKLKIALIFNEDLPLLRSKQADLSLSFKLPQDTQSSEIQYATMILTNLILAFRMDYESLNEMNLSANLEEFLRQRGYDQLYQKILQDLQEGKIQPVFSFKSSQK